MDGKPLFDIICNKCGGWEQYIKEAKPDHWSMLRCTACHYALGRVAGFHTRAVLIAEQAGHIVDRTLYDQIKAESAELRRKAHAAADERDPN